ncbi:MAG: hypothetical protein RL033_6685 [Pseudomonadota bacterium]|jgi:hypothetical protein
MWHTSRRAILPSASTSGCSASVTSWRTALRSGLALGASHYLLVRKRGVTALDVTESLVTESLVTESLVTESLVSGRDT